MIEGSIEGIEKFSSDNALHYNLTHSFRIQINNEGAKISPKNEFPL